ncbi:MAG: PmbA/TldA family metallopeptidase, partial [Fidelibacterota bacterium]
MNTSDLKQILNGISLDADWVGLRAVRESTTYRIIRDDKPQANHRGETHGIMIEVLVDGQFGYYGVNSSDPETIQTAAEKAAQQAKLAAPFAVHKFAEDVRPVAKGEYYSP